DRTYLYFDKQFGVYDNAWILYGSGGQYITSRSFYQDYSSDSYNDAELWLDSGEYWLILQGNGANGWNGSSNDYKLRIVTPQLNTAPMSLGTTITGTISEQGEQDTYTFEGTAGQQLFYDGFGDANLLFRFFDPTGRELFNVDSRSDRGSDASLTLAMNGTYKVLIDGERDATGSYGFRLLDKADATVINLDRDIAGTFDNGGFESDSYRFTLTDRSYLYFDKQFGNYDNAWILYGPNGQLITSRTFHYDYYDGYNDAELWLDSGEYWLILQGNGAEYWTDGSNDYKLRIVTPQLKTNPYTVGTTIAANITEAGEQNTYTFTGEIGQQLFLDAFAGDPNISINLYSPTGRLLRNSDVRSNIGPDGGYTLNEAGIYSLVIDGIRDYTGNYSFRLLDKAKATRISFDQDITGTFANSGLDSQIYRFTVTMDQYLYFDAQTGDSANQWILYGNGGQLITYTNLSNDQEFWLGKGEYLLVAQGNGGTNLGYQFRLVTPDLITNSLTLGSQVSGIIAEAGEQDTYTFTGSIGQKLFFDALVGNSNIKTRLYAPSGVLILDKDTNADWGAFNLGEAGIYRLVIDANGETTGNYSFVLSDRRQAPVITLSNAITGQLEQGNQVKLYQINGKAGQQLNFDLTANQWSGANWILYNPSGGIVKAPDLSNPDFTVILSSTDIYTLAIIGNSSDPVDYSFQITDITPTSVTTTGLNIVQSGTLNSGQIVDYNFTANAGTLLLFDAQNPDPSNWQIRTRLYNPDGSLVIDNQDARYDQFISLEQTGNYKVQIYGYYESTSGDYQFNLLEVPKTLASRNTNYLEIGGTTTGTLNYATTKLYTFSGIAGQRIFFNSLYGDGINVNLYDPNGAQIYTTSGNLAWSNDSSPFTLTQNGLYQVLVQNNSGGQQNYAFQVLDSANAPEITYSLPITGSINNGQQSQIFKLQATAGETLYFDNLGWSASNQPWWYYQYYHWKLFGAGNNQLFDNYQNTDTEIVIPETGDYYLLLQGGPDGSKVDYNFRVTRIGAKPTDILTPGAGETANNNPDQLGFFPVKIGVKDTQGGTAIQDYQIRLWADPENSNPVIISEPEKRFALDTKAYRYQLKAIDGDGDP
ncbi:MAG: hypothetical protein ACKPA7_01385, partial [Sphaerospermopsis kisseleviana]